MEGEGGGFKIETTSFLRKINHLLKKLSNFIPLKGLGLNAIMILKKREKKITWRKTAETEI